MKAVTPKKKLGQHFLNDLNIAEKITNQPFINHGKNVLEIGPGMGVLTNFLIKKKINLKLIEIDNEACLLYTSPSPRDATLSRMPSSA